MMRVRICLVGLGAVGQGFLRAAQLKAEYLKKRYGLELTFTGIADSSGAIHDGNGIDIAEILRHKKMDGVGRHPMGVEGMSGLELLDEVEYDCLVEATPTSITDGEPGRSLLMKALGDGKHVVTSNKGHLALFYSELMELSSEAGAELMFEASVGGAMPIINLARETLTSCSIESVIGILNGTTNFILSRMTSEGSSYEQALLEAQELGIAETNPAQDVEGTDAACKAVILANAILGRPCTLRDVSVEGITGITQGAIELAAQEGYLIKLIAEISDDTLEVGPRLVRMGSPYAVDGTLNMATLRTDLAGEVTAVGRGAGSLETASAMLTDTLTIWRRHRDTR
ncbi:homoserine dehydrogenase [Methanothermobacter sp. KEPCO 2]